LPAYLPDFVIRFIIWHSLPCPEAWRTKKKKKKKKDSVYWILTDQLSLLVSGWLCVVQFVTQECDEFRHLLPLLYQKVITSFRPFGRIAPNLGWL
jgi:hypothetical protein